VPVLAGTDFNSESGTGQAKLPFLYNFLRVLSGDLEWLFFRLQFLQHSFVNPWRRSNYRLRGR
jgi:hypothetical protein